MINPNDRSPRYVLVESDRFILSLARALGPERTSAWSLGLAQTLSDLTGFPGPLAHARDEEACPFFGREVRRLLYYGPTRRRTGTPARILFTLLPPADDEPEPGETVVFLLRLLHGSQSLLPPDSDPNSI